MWTVPIGVSSGLRVVDDDGAEDDAKADGDEEEKRASSSTRILARSQFGHLMASSLGRVPRTTLGRSATASLACWACLRIFFLRMTLVACFLVLASAEHEVWKALKAGGRYVLNIVASQLSPAQLKEIVSDTDTL